MVGLAVDVFSKRESKAKVFIHCLHIFL